MEVDYAIRLNSSARKEHLEATLVGEGRNGMDWIHAYKFPSSIDINERINKSIEAGVKYRIFDIGSLPRVCENPESLNIETLPNGDLGIRVSVGDQIALISKDTSSKDFNRIHTKYGDTVRILRTTKVPIFIEKGLPTKPSEISFGDNDVICEATELIKMQEVTALMLTVQEINNAGFVFANHKITSRTDPLTELHTPSSLDIEILESVLPENRLLIEFVALSFVTAEGIIELKRELKRLGFENAKIIAKIESLKGVHEIEKIALLTKHVMLALGDLEIVCRREGWDFRVTVFEILRRIKDYDLIIYAASGLADSLIYHNAVELTSSESYFLKELYSKGVRVFGLTKETWVTFEPDSPERMYSLVNVFLHSLLELRKKID